MKVETRCNGIEALIRGMLDGVGKEGKGNERWATERIKATSRT